MPAGERFGKLVATNTYRPAKRGKQWLCFCDCGGQAWVLTNSLLSGNSKSCGCTQGRHPRPPSIVYYKNHKDRLLQDRGEAVARTYESWAWMRRRVREPVGRNSCYVGVTITSRWDDFEMFLADMGFRPEGTSIDRIDGAKGYEPGNCRWATTTIQGRNRKTVKIDMTTAEHIRRRYAAGGVSQQKLADDYSVSQVLVSQIIRGLVWR